MLQGVTRGYQELQGVTRGYRGLQGVTGGYKGLQRVIGAYKGLQRVTSGLNGLQGVTEGYRKTCFLARTSKDTFHRTKLRVSACGNATEPEHFLRKHVFPQKVFRFRRVSASGNT